MDRFFSISMPAAQFVRNVLLFSFAALLPVLLFYVLLAPGFAPALAAGGPALMRLLRQVATNGLPVVFAVNYVSFFLFAMTKQPKAGSRDTAFFVLVDVLLRALLFPGLHVLIYVLSADWFGSFGGNRSTALAVVSPTLARSAFFENISRRLPLCDYDKRVAALRLGFRAVGISWTGCTSLAHEHGRDAACPGCVCLVGRADHDRRTRHRISSGQVMAG
ncbi:hypothetical protein [Salipiger profundus]|uniref:hypothetical protein n=1 Tax=Salipiger profundus TaxID=1229727 RepID=UPI0008E2F0E0|nr:hypothetical protein [Salipiger profundus]SFD61166.1 hypothetical protein SAMN05444415_11362 [Salipiger profundus]